MAQVSEMKFINYFRMQIYIVQHFRRKITFESRNSFGGEVCQADL